MQKEFCINLPITLQAVNYSRYYVQRMVTFEARWRTSASKFQNSKLQNYIKTTSSVSATLDLLFPLSEAFNN